MRRLSALLALLALSRLSLSGVAIACTAPGDAPEQHPHGSTATTPAVTQEHDTADANGDSTDCGNEQQVSCLSMSSCLNAVASEPSVGADGVCGTERVVDSTSDRVFELLRAPEPPPPRA